MQVGALNSYWLPFDKNYLVKGRMKQKQRNKWEVEWIWEFI